MTGKMRCTAKSKHTTLGERNSPQRTRRKTEAAQTFEASVLLCALCGETVFHCAGRRFRTARAGLGRPVCVLIIAALLFTVVNAQGQDRRPPKDQFRPQPSAASSGDATLPGVLVEPDADYRIAPGDIIEVQVEDAPELTGTFRVTAGGTFLMTYLNRITARQKTAEELANLIADGLRGRYLKDPHVKVVVRQINSHSFFIQGAVRRPGVYQIEGRPSLLKLITVAGGLADNHGSTAFIIRELKPKGAGGKDKEAADTAAPSPPAPQPPAGSVASDAQAQTQDAEAEKGQYELIQANITGLLKGRFDQNTFVEPGDIVNIPQTDVFFVAGEVREPGSFPLKEGTTLRQAISLAQGLTFKAASGSGIIFRDDPASGHRQEIRVDVGAIMNGKKDDIAILANDIIIVPNSRSKSVSSVLLNSFSTGGLSALPYLIFR